MFASTVLAGCDAAAEPRRTLLPPTAGDDFLAECIRCRRCGEVCTAGCIEFHPPWSTPELAGTPYIEPRLAGCNTCTMCTQVCPTGALTPIDVEDRLEEISMGVAYVDPGLCLSFLGRVCGVCHDACPFPSEAIALGVRAQPEVLEACVGCGRCEERCPQIPAAIRVFRTPPTSPRWEGPE
ncbi:MAG: 4Fe-4S dicluster domain-containing protein [Proteobacteria bacterium]|nr:4Fe-4S dicluster domain-containing protein [Pseudomonadota bacterium]MCP4916610.1 4Fe-4S dicluster domain-containing protein [Pseudomonadota bacterium]